MKKPKRSDEWEEPSADSSKEIDAVLDNLDDLGDLDDDIIDLEDVVEPYTDGHQDDDELASDAEILDAKGSLGLRGFEDKGESDDEFLLEDDLLKELAFFRDDKEETETDQTAESLDQELDHLTPGLLGDSDAEIIEEPTDETERLILDELELEPSILTVSMPAAEEPEVSITAVAAPAAEEPEPEISAAPVEASLPDEVGREGPAPPLAEPVVEEPELEISAPPVGASVPEEAHPGAFVLPVAAPLADAQEVETPIPLVAASTEAVVSLDDFIARIENKLVETIREIVEARLPEIVRTILMEEIEKLKSDQGPED